MPQELGVVFAVCDALKVEEVKFAKRRWRAEKMRKGVSRQKFCLLHGRNRGRRDGRQGLCLEGQKPGRAGRAATGCEMALAGARTAVCEECKICDRREAFFCEARAP